MTQRRKAALWILDHLARCEDFGADIAEMIDRSVPADLLPMFEADHRRQRPGPALELLHRAGMVNWDTFGVFIWLTETGKRVAQAMI